MSDTERRAAEPPVRDMYRLAYSDYSTMSLTDIHRSITYLARRQRAVRLHHRAARLRVLRGARARRMQAIAALMKTLTED